MPADLTDAEVSIGPEISPADLATRLGEPGSISVDTRGGMAYRAGHVPGPVKIRDDCPEDMLRHRSPFPAGRTIVLIC